MHALFGNYPGRQHAVAVGADAGDGSCRTAQSKLYWDQRARRFASQGSGLAAVCAYGMPWFYNGAIHLLQYLALRPWLRVPSGTRVLEIGCGVGRWSRRLASRGASVTGIDLSQHMVTEARRRTREHKPKGPCNFLVSDVSAPAVTGRFDVVFGVTVLQHVLTAGQFERAVQSLTDHLAPGGRMILLEAAPSRPVSRCDSAIFVAREERLYFEAFRRAGLKCVTSIGVDPMPWKTAFLPHYGRLPRPLALAILMAIMVVSVPIDLIFGRRLRQASWHKVFVLEHESPLERCIPTAVACRLPGADA